MKALLYKEICWDSCKASRCITKFKSNLTLGKSANPQPEEVRKVVVRRSLVHYFVFPRVNMNLECKINIALCLRICRR